MADAVVAGAFADDDVPIELTMTKENDDVSLAALATQCPTSTAAERRRFLRARKGKLDAAAEMLTGNLTWREEQLPQPVPAAMPMWITHVDDLRAFALTKSAFSFEGVHILRLGLMLRRAWLACRPKPAVVDAERDGVWSHLEHL